MGNAPSVVRHLLGREQSAVETVALSPTSVYKWPPKIGNYFANYFIMGGQKFDTPQPEAYLFGDNNDLNFLGSRPQPFPYPLTSQPNEPTRTLQSLVNVRKDTLRLVKSDSPVVAESSANDGVPAAAHVTDPAEERQTAGGPAFHVVDEQAGSSETDVGGSAASIAAPPQLYNIEFIFDSDAPCTITVLYFAKEEVGSGTVAYHSRDSSMSSRGYSYPSGANQTFSQPEHCIQPSKFADADWLYNNEKDEIPVVIHCAVDSNDSLPHAHITFAAIERTADGYSIKAIKQKQLVDGLAYILQEFYGIENKDPGSQLSDGDDLDDDDNTSECVICMSDVRDTLILPCRHLCLCYGCADSLRFQASNCPICRSPFHALLQIRAIRKKAPSTAVAVNVASTSAGAGDGVASADDGENGSGVSQKNVPAGYEAVSLIEALNGVQRRPAAVGTSSGSAEAGAASLTGSARRSASSAEASLRRSRRQKQLSGGDRSASVRRSKSKATVPSCLSSSANRESTTTDGEDQQQQQQQLPLCEQQQQQPTSCSSDGSSAAAAGDVEAGPAARGVDELSEPSRLTDAEVAAASNAEAAAAAAHSTVAVAVQTDETRMGGESLDDDRAFDTAAAAACTLTAPASDSNLVGYAANPPLLGRVQHRDDDTDSGIPDDLTEDGRATSDDLNAPELRRVASASTMTRSAGALPAHLSDTKTTDDGDDDRQAAKVTAAGKEKASTDQ